MFLRQALGTSQPIADNYPSLAFQEYWNVCLQNTHPKRDKSKSKNCIGDNCICEVSTSPNSLPWSTFDKLSSLGFKTVEAYKSTVDLDEASSPPTCHPASVPTLCLLKFFPPLNAKETIMKMVASHVIRWMTLANPTSLLSYWMRPLHSAPTYVISFTELSH